MNTNSNTQLNNRQTPPKPRRRSSTQLKNPTLWIIGGASALVVFLVIAGFGLLLVLAILPDRIASGVTIAGVPVGGDSVNEATTALQRNLPAQTLTLTDGDRNWAISPADIGVLIDVPATLQAAENAQPNTNVTPRYTVDLSAAQNGFIALSEQINIDAVPGEDGRAMDIPMMLDRLRVDVTGEIGDGVFQLDMIITPAPEAGSGVDYDGPTTTYVVQQGQELGLIAKDYNVSVADIVALNDISNPDMIYPGQELIIPAAGEYVPAPPPAPTSSGRSIVVSTENQRIYAYENGQMVRTHLVSTGLPATPTVKGDYRVYVKHVATDMSGPDYFLPQVPYTMYFFQGYGIHGTYWHNAFGRAMSHGCVNLPTDEAQRFFNFASVGTPVRVI
jgi:lipoprotein-anchoring transpeptidase ErfK/SrfK